MRELLERKRLRTKLGRVQWTWVSMIISWLPLLLSAEILSDEFFNLRERGAWQEHLPDAVRHQFWYLLLRDDAADENPGRANVALAQGGDDLRHLHHVIARQQAETDVIGPVRDDGIHHLLAGPPEPGVRDLHAGFAQRVRDA